MRLLAMAATWDKNHVPSDLLEALGKDLDHKRAEADAAVMHLSKLHGQAAWPID